MIELPREDRRPSPHGLVPLINIVFLLLVFFLITATLEASPPFDIEALEGEGDLAENRDRAYVSAAGDVAFGDSRGAEALLLVAAREGVTIVADGRLSAEDFASLLAELRRLGAGELTLEMRAP